MSRAVSIVVAVLSILTLRFIDFSDSNPPLTEIEHQIFLPIVGNWLPSSVLLDIPILYPGGPSAATDLESEVGCGAPGEAIAKLNWTVAMTPGDEQRVDVTIFRDGFETGEFETSKPLPADQSDLVWELVETGLNHRWRVLTRQENGWMSSEPAIFKGPICVGDSEPKPVPPIPERF